LGSLLALAACADSDTVESNDRSGLVTTASVARSAQDADGNGKASMFGAPREARILFW
jgi:hypothetical protein